MKHTELLHEGNNPIYASANHLEGYTKGRKSKIRLEEGEKLFVFAGSYQKACYWVTLLKLGPGQFIYLDSLRNMVGVHSCRYIDVGCRPYEWGDKELEEEERFKHSNNEIRDWRSLC